MRKKTTTTTTTTTTTITMAIMFLFFSTYAWSNPATYHLFLSLSLSPYQNIENLVDECIQTSDVFP
jgi:hypothetical protein